MDVINLGSRFVNNYIYKSGGGYVLVDTGYEKGYARFQKALEKHRIGNGEIKYIFLTHAHDDHAGFLNQLLTENTEAKVIMSAAALPILYRGQNVFKGGCTSRLALYFCKFMNLLGKGAHKFPSLSHSLESRCLFVTEKNRREIEKAVGGKIYRTPGHTADSISLLLEDGTLFCGDAAMNGFPSLHKITIFAENRDTYMKSWKRLIELRPKTILPGHGGAFSYTALEKNLPNVEKMSVIPLKPVK